MDTHLIFRLVGLRYQLLWAQTRTRNGRIALFITGYFFAILILVLMGAGGFGAALVAVRTGQAEKVARAVLGGLFLNALFASVVTGFGINSAFTDDALRRFPLAPAERMAARHLTGILEPVWIFVLALDLGLSTGMAIFGDGNFFLGAAAMVLLVMTNYLLARVLATLIEWLTKVRGGTVILLLMLVTVGMLPGLLAPRIEHAHGFVQTALAALRWTPPFAAAALTVKPAMGPVLSNLVLLGGWIAGLLAALVAIERQAVRPRTAVAAAASWNMRYERVASIFGSELAPLVGRTLRYYARSNKARFNFILAIPVMAFFVFSNPPSGDSRHYFVRALGALAAAGFLGTAVMCVNQFGCDASGFRRHFLLPVPPRMVLRASSYTAMFLGGAVVAAALVLWLLFAPVPFDLRMAPMLLAAGLGGLFLFNALAIWTSLLAPRPMEFETTFGNQLSLAGNILLIGGLMVMIGGAMVLDQTAGPQAVLNWWWVSIPLLLAAAAFYFTSLRLGTGIFAGRKERLLNIIERRS